MAHYGGKTPKAHVGYSNCCCVGALSRGRLPKNVMKRLKRKTSTTRRYVDKQGRVRYVGNKNLKLSQHLDYCAASLRASPLLVVVLSTTAILHVKSPDILEPVARSGKNAYLNTSIALRTKALPTWIWIATSSAVPALLESASRPRPTSP